MSVVNVRVSASTRGELAEAAKRDNLADSTWAREVVVAVLATGMSLPELQRLLVEHQVREPSALEPAVLTGRRMLGARVKVSGRCLCPQHLREAFPTFDRCRECGTEHPR